MLLRVCSPLTVVMLLVTCVAAQTNVTPVSPVIVLLDGQEVSAENIALADGRLTGKGLANGVSVDDIRQIRLRPKDAATTAKPGIQIELRGEGRLAATAISVGDDACMVTTATAGKLKLPIDVVRSIAFDAAALPADYYNALQTPSADYDRIFLRGDQTVDGVNGLIESLDDKVIKFELEGRTVTQPRQKLVAIVVAQSIAGDDLPQSTITLSDGSSLGGDLVRIAEEQITIKLAGKEVSLPWWSARNIAVRSSKMAFLSDLKPSSAEQQSIVTLPRPWQRDRSYSGKPLQLGDKTFEKGIGTHARSQIAFDLQGKYEEFAAVVGIDAATDGKGDCVMSVLADGTRLWSSRVRGSDPPQRIKLQVAGAQELTLLVEPGADLDLADHAVWADARVIRSAK